MPDIYTGIPSSSLFLDPNQYILQTKNDLPHWYQEGKLQFITFRLADSIPVEDRLLLASQISAFNISHPQPWNEETENEFNERFLKRHFNLLDKGYGHCWLRNEDCRKIVLEALLYREEEGLIELGDTVIMPNHVHFLAAFHEEVEDVMENLMEYTARQINKVVKRRGRLWNRKFFDRMIRDDAHLNNVIAYIRNNPLKAKLPPSDYLLYTPEGSWV